MAEVSIRAGASSPRVPFHAAVKFRCAGENDWSYGQAIDVSDTGLLFFCEREVTPHVRIEITLLDSVGGVNSVVMRGEIVRVDFLSISAVSTAVAVRFDTE
jgi:hypothetical protein